MVWVFASHAGHPSALVRVLLCYSFGLDRSCLCQPWHILLESFASQELSVSTAALHAMFGAVNVCQNQK